MRQLVQIVAGIHEVQKIVFGIVCQTRLLSDFEFVGERNAIQPCPAPVPDPIVSQNELVVGILGSKFANLHPGFIARFEPIRSDGRAVHGLGLRRDKDTADIAVDHETVHTQNFCHGIEGFRNHWLPIGLRHVDLRHLQAESFQSLAVSAPAATFQLPD